MEVKVIIQRRYSEEEKKSLKPILGELYQLVFEFGGFVSGEALVNCEDPRERVIISQWNSIEQWKRYHEADRVRTLCSMIDTIIGKVTTHKVFIPEKQ